MDDRFKEYKTEIRNNLLAYCLLDILGWWHFEANYQDLQLIIGDLCNNTLVLLKPNVK